MDRSSTPEPDRARTTLRGDETLTADPSRAHEARRVDAEPLAPGRRIARFTLLRKLGEGGMGIVHAAYDDELDRKVAIKLVRGERVDELARARVLREAQALARVSHPNVVQIYDVGVHDEQIYVAMEFVAGPTLAAWTEEWRARAKAEAREAWPEILARYVDAGRGLAAAHAAGLVHRDFKPANAIVGDDGRVRVLDFGIARPIAGALPRLRPVSESGGTIGDTSADTNQSTTLTRTGAMVGTPAYMSLEQFESADVDARSDQFSFCVALWEALHGERPFEGRNAAALIWAMREGRVRTPASTSDVPTWLRDHIRRGLASDPGERWPSMDALLAALLDDPERRRRLWRRRAGLGLLTLGLLAGSLMFARAQMASAERAQAERAMALEEEAVAQRWAIAAQAERDRALAEARASALRARDTARILAARSLVRDPTLAVALLREVENRAAPGWRSAALEVLQRPVSRHVLAVHDDRVVDVEYSPDGAWLASASFDGKVRLWSSAALGSGAYYELDHGDRVFDIDFDPSGRRLVGASRERSARVWSLPTAPATRPAQPLEASHVLRGQAGILWTARFSSTGDRVVTAARSGEIWVWTLADRREPTPSQRLVIGDEIVWHAEFSPDDRNVAIAVNDGRVLIWDLERDAVRELSRHAGPAWVAHFSPDGRWIASASQTGELRLDPVDPSQGEGTTLRGHTGPVQRLAFSPDGRTLASCSHDKTARVWTFDEAGRPRGDSRVFEVGSAFALTPAFSPDGRWLALGGVEPIVRVIELAGGQAIELRGHTSDVFSLRFSPDGSQLITGSYDQSVRVWDTDWAAVERRFAGLLAPDPRGRWLIERRSDERARLWRIDSNRITPAGLTREPLAENANQQAWSSEGDWLVLPGARGELLGFEPDEANVAELAPRWRIAAVGPPTSLQISADARWLIAATRVRLRLWHFAEGLAGGPREVELGESGSHEPAVAVVAVSLDGRWLISTSIRGDVRISQLDPASGSVGEAHVYPGVQSGRNNGIVLDPAGEWVAISALDRSVRVWNFARLDEPPLVAMLTSEARSIIYEAGSDRVLLGCYDGALRSLDPHTGVVELLDEGKGTLFALELAANQSWLAFGTANGDLGVRDDLPALHSSEPFVLPTETGIRRLDFVDEDRRLLVADSRGGLRLLALGEGLDEASLLARLREVSEYCPSVDERVRYAGEAPESARRSCE
ncbi:protein kinase domain-containing protein [Nannocystaceae bacterium ST9]